MDDALAKALKLADGPAALGRAISVTSQAISQWKRVPAKRALAVEAATGVPRHELRPDLYPAPANGICLTPETVAAGESSHHENQTEDVA